MCSSAEPSSVLVSSNPMNRKHKICRISKIDWQYICADCRRCGSTCSLYLTWVPNDGTMSLHPALQTKAVCYYAVILVHSSLCYCVSVTGTVVCRIYTQLCCYVQVVITASAAVMIDTLSHEKTQSTHIPRNNSCHIDRWTVSLSDWQVINSPRWYSLPWAFTLRSSYYL